MTTSGDGSLAAVALIGVLAGYDPALALCEEHLARFAVMAARAGDAEPTRQGRVAVLPISGPLLPRGGQSFFGSWRGMDSIRGQLATLADDDDVSAIVLDIDSPGGTVAGTAETAAAVRAAAAKKKVIAVANPLAASAAYWIGSQASEFVAAPGADLGSIGVLAMHTDISKALADAGVAVNVIRSAKYKGEGMPFSPLSDDTRAFMQSKVDDAHSDFVRDVAAGRGVTQTAVRENFGEGRVVNATSAVKRGMADRIGTLDSVVAGLVGVKPRRRSVAAFAAF